MGRFDRPSDFWRTLMRGKWLVVMSLALCNVSLARAEVKTKTVTYEYDGVTLKGFLAWDDAAKGKRPGVLVVHEWWGLNDYARKRAEQLAGLGFVAFAADMYGEGKVTEHPKEAGAMATRVRANVQDWRNRATKALEVLASQPQCDKSKL